MLKCKREILHCKRTFYRVFACAQATMHSSVSQWLLWHGAISAAEPSSSSTTPLSSPRVPSAYPAVLLWISGAVVSAGSFVIVLQVHT